MSFLTRFDLYAISAAPIVASPRIWTTPNAATTAITLPGIATVLTMKMATAVWSCMGGRWRDDTEREAANSKGILPCVGAGGSESAAVNRCQGQVVLKWSQFVVFQILWPHSVFFRLPRWSLFRQYAMLIYTVPCLRMPRYLLIQMRFDTVSSRGWFGGGRSDDLLSA